MVKVSAADAKWQKESDARTLVEAETIKADKSRLSGAQKAAKAMVAEKQKEAASLSKVAAKKTVSSARPKVSASRSTRKK
jgi:hypothetical protein